MKTHIILSQKSWNKDLKTFLEKKHPEFQWILISKKEDFTFEELNKIKPEFIFIPHWSYIIPEEIFSKHNCIVFHMTDLPFGRGGSPLQNLISKGFTKTKISAIKVVKEIDAGPIYLKKDLDLYGTAEEIFIRANNIINEMISEIVDTDMTPMNQEGEVHFFKRRKPEMSAIHDIKEIHSLYDHIRMLDAEGYPKAFIEYESFRFEFSRATIKASGEIIADVIIKKI